MAFSKHLQSNCIGVDDINLITAITNGYIAITELQLTKHTMTSSTKTSRLIAFLAITSSLGARVEQYLKAIKPQCISLAVFDQ